MHSFLRPSDPTFTHSIPRRPEKFKGIVPRLDPAKFLELPPARQEWLMNAEVIAMVKEFTKSSRPSVTVKL
jgi:hypothetical protein